MSTLHQTVEHIVLLNVKPDVDPSKVTTMIDQCNGLASLGLTAQLHAGKLLRCTTTTSSLLNFTHILHCRFTSRDHLQVYYDHPEHLRVVGENIQPVIDDAVAVDWISNGINTDSLNPGSVMRVTLFKLKDQLAENEKYKLVEEMKSGFLKIRTEQQISSSVGENFSHEMAKGHSIVTIAVFPDLEASHHSDAAAQLADLHKLKVKQLIESEVVVDYVAPLLQDRLQCKTNTTPPLFE